MMGHDDRPLSPSVMIVRRISEVLGVAAASMALMAVVVGAVVVLLGEVGPVWLRIVAGVAVAAFAVFMAIGVTRRQLREYVESDDYIDSDDTMADESQ
jgi:membrane protein YdbS with pleckstrin-like domain